MPDTMIQDITPAQAPVSCGVMSGYRSDSIGKLVSARAKASAKIKAIVKDKKAKVESRKEGGRSYEYAYADLSTIFDSIEEAISEQGLAIIQTTQDRGRDGTYLITTLAHESDQWVAGEIRLKNADQGPQVYGSEMTYLRRYAVLAALALAPEADDDGKAAQDRADQQPKPPRQDRVKPAPKAMPTAPKATPAASDEPQRMLMPMGQDGPLLGRWTKAALEALDGKSPEWRHAWLALHVDEMTELRWSRADYADRIDAAVVGTDAQDDAA